MLSICFYIPFLEFCVILIEMCVFVFVFVSVMICVGYHCRRWGFGNFYVRIEGFQIGLLVRSTLMCCFGSGFNTSSYDF